ncbi:uncharacterized protein LOC121733379 [Aricia agestis]|uniref:uncharacterized protein LOC121733379 n=1 Tax=Aricia agestis TaxID=91739 RepID=UPI001C202E7F|nr:uncharacterized protein LOC121733379 [Aricia agestis]
MYIDVDVFCQGNGNMALERVTRYQQIESESGGGGVSGLCARDAASPAQMLPPAPAPPATVKTERSSPHDSTASRSRSVTPSTSSHPSTTPERVSPAAPPPRHYSEIMRTLAARYNTGPNDFFHRNGFGAPPVDVGSAPLGGLFAKLAVQQGTHIPAFPATVDMTSTKTLLALSRVACGRSRRKRIKRNVSDHSPLDLSTAGDVKRARYSPSSEGEERVSNGESSETRECLCAEARARLSAMSVDEVVEFVASIDICAEYATNFRDQRIDGSGLPLLTEEHLTGMLQMKLGPALKLRAAVAKKIEPCAQCAAPTTPRTNGTFKPEPRSNTTSPS